MSLGFIHSYFFWLRPFATGDCGKVMSALVGEGRANFPSFKNVVVGHLSRILSILTRKMLEKVCRKPQLWALNGRQVWKVNVFRRHQRILNSLFCQRAWKIIAKGWWIRNYMKIYWWLAYEKRSGALDIPEVAMEREVELKQYLKGFFTVFFFKLGG